jgi:hypothetical protein
MAGEDGAADLAVEPQAPLSTEIDTEASPSASGGGQLRRGEDTGGKSLRDDLETVFKNQDRKDREAAKADKADNSQPPENEAKDEKGENPDEELSASEDKGEADKSAEETGDKPREDKPARRHVEPPQSFVPRAKELWRNTPLEVQAEVERLTKEHDEASQVHSQVVQRYESLRPFDELAHRNGRDLTQSLTRINQIENLMQQNPLFALNMVLAEIGPKKADGQPLSLFEVASHVAQMGQQGYQQVMGQATQQAQQAQQGQQEQAKVAALEAQLHDLRVQQVAQQWIEPFRAAHPRYDELEPRIAFFMDSDMVPRSLSPPDRLALAYDLAERVNPSPGRANGDGSGDPASARRADEDLSGTKSIKSAPGSVSEMTESSPRQGESIRDALYAEARRSRRA